MASELNGCFEDASSRSQRSEVDPFPPVDGSMSGLAPATIFGGCEVDLGRADVAQGKLVAGARFCVITREITVPAPSRSA
jgi:hypothetical protein